jgi:DNA/RNA endonuclease YhcR with UshA esterase domain
MTSALVARDNTRNNGAMSGDCVNAIDASKHVGTQGCVRGMVQHVGRGGRGTTVLSFCKDEKGCPFNVVVFPAELKKLGDVGQLEGKQIEIKGTIQDYDGHAEIVLRKPQQLGEAAFLLFPQVPTDYDVERSSRNKAGNFDRLKEKKKREKKQGDPMSIEDPEDPQ